MKNINYFDIQSLINNNEDITDIIDNIHKLMEKEYPNFCEWFDNKLVTELNKGTRNIIVITNRNKIIGFTNLKKTDKERKISNIYVKSFIYYEKCWNLLINNAIIWLEEEDPVIIISKKELNKCHNLVKKRNWYLTDITKNHDYVLNRYDEFEILKKYIKRKVN